MAESGEKTPAPAADFSAMNAVQPPQIPDERATKEQEMLEGASPKMIRREVHRILIYALRVGAAILAVLLVVRFWHVAAPTSWRWLLEADIQSMDKMLFSSAFGGAVFSYLQTVLVPKKSE